MPVLGQRSPDSTWLKNKNPLKCHDHNAEHAEFQQREKILYPPPKFLNASKQRL